MALQVCLHERLRHARLLLQQKQKLIVQMHRLLDIVQVHAHNIFDHQELFLDVQLVLANRKNQPLLREALRLGTGDLVQTRDGFLEATDQLLLHGIERVAGEEEQKNNDSLSDSLEKKCTPSRHGERNER